MMLAVIFVLLVLSPTTAFHTRSVPIALRRGSNNHLCGVRMSTDSVGSVDPAPVINVAQIASRWKLVKYRATSSAVDVDIECSDKLYREKKIKIPLSREGGIGTYGDGMLMVW